MPRTKVSKNSKRNREAAKLEEKIRDFDASVDKFLNLIERKGQEQGDEIDGEIVLLLQRTNNMILKMKFGEFLDMGLTKFANNTTEQLLYPSSATAQSLSGTTSTSSTLFTSAKTINPTDEGYLTADGSDRGSVVIPTNGNNTSTSRFLQPQLTQQQQQQRGRTPGPFSSARARRPRRSRSACGMDVVVSLAPLKSVSSATPAEHMARNKFRTPNCGRTKAQSADRSSQVNVIQDSKSPPTAILRWPKPGELVVSMCGSPVVAQVMPDKYANVNIPIRNGVLSLQPKKINDIKPEILENIDSETLGQIKTLHENLNVIMNMAEKFTLN